MARAYRNSLIDMLFHISRQSPRAFLLILIADTCCGVKCFGRRAAIALGKQHG